MTSPFPNTDDMDEAFKTAVNQVITGIPDRFIDEDIADAVQVLFRDFGAGANFTELKKVISMIYGHALPTGARNDKMVFLMAHIIRPKPAMFHLSYKGREAQAETLAHEFILNKMYSFSLETAVWDRRPFDIVSEFAENYEHLQIPVTIMRYAISTIIDRAAGNEHLFQKVNFDLFVQLVMDHGHLMGMLLATLQNVALRAESESLDLQLMAAGLLSIVKERRSASGGV